MILDQNHGDQAVLYWSGYMAYFADRLQTNHPLVDTASFISERGLTFLRSMDEGPGPAAFFDLYLVN